MLKLIFLSLPCILFLKASGQLDSSSLHSFIERKKSSGTLAEGLYRFYAANSYTPVWFSSGGLLRRDELRSMLDSTDAQKESDEKDLGSLIAPFTTGNLATGSAEDSANAEIAFSEALLSFVYRIKGFSKRPYFRYDGLKVAGMPGSIDSLCGSVLANAGLPALIDHISPKLKEIHLIEARLRLLTARHSQHTSEEVITSTVASSGNKALLKKLFALGIIDTLSGLPDSSVKQAVRKAQTMFNLLNDGVLRSTFLQEMNVPINERIRRLNVSLDHYRWLHAVSATEPAIVVNITATTLTVYQADSVWLRMRMIVGKPATPTPTLTSRVEDIVFYPYWNVPYNIAVHEMLPSIKRNLRYIDANNLQVLDKSGRILDPASISWSRLNAGNFPYRLRQSTGCDNALGILKVQFYNPFSVYLHDTPVKSLFMLNKRYFSHGCMRMEQPIDLVLLLLNNRWPADLDTTVCLEDQKPVVMPALTQMPVIVWYNPAGVDERDNLIFYEDIYRRWNDRRE